MAKGFFVTVEGIDGTGKTTQLNRLVQKLEAAGHDVVVVKEPGDKVNGQYIGSEIGAQIRNILFFDPTTHKLDKDVVDLLFLCDHLQLWRNTIVPALAAGKTVVSDRYCDSQFAYGAAKESSDWIQALYVRLYGPVPDATVLLIGDPEFLLPRTKNRGGSEENKQDGKKWAGLQAQELVKQTYLKNLAGEPRTIIVDVTPEKDIEAVHNEVWAGVEARLMAKTFAPGDRKQMSLFEENKVYIDSASAFRTDV